MEVILSKVKNSLYNIKLTYFILGVEYDRENHMVRNYEVIDIMTRMNYCPHRVIWRGQHS